MDGLTNEPSMEHYIERLCDLTPSEYNNINDRLESLLDKISNGDKYET